jgi:hypothetical protein
MLMLDLYPWARFIAGVVTGCWIGVMIGCAVALLLAGRRVRQLESMNLLLRLKLNARREQTGGLRATGPGLALPRSGGNRTADALISRIARVN